MTQVAKNKPDFIELNYSQLCPVAASIETTNTQSLYTASFPQRVQNWLYGYFAVIETQSLQIPEHLERAGEVFSDRGETDVQGTDTLGAFFHARQDVIGEMDVSD